ncbi:uncharacterized protein ACNS7B_013331 isoform 1-T2 [Menidia menidia]|uniref:(Atlantic silverside) hypothetical protein n=1 Tax=Menidia menidia TaxID=238744 RepID=A0A8S4AQV4_9TELE|nr:unnamed protein product [Menidia menidia]
MPWWTTSRMWFCLVLLSFCSSAENAGPADPLSTFPHEQASGEADLEDGEWGSGSALLHLLHSFPGDSPFVAESSEKAANCSQRFRLPPSPPVCWENMAGPEEFSKSRLLVLQNRAALQAVSTSSGVEEGGSSYNHQAREEVQGIRSDHQSMVETVHTMETVFVSLREKRRDGKEQGVLTSMKERLAQTRDAIDGREHMADILESQFSTLEKTLLNIGFRLNKLIQQ